MEMLFCLFHISLFKVYRVVWEVWLGGYGHFTARSKGATPGMLCTMAASFSIASADTTATAIANRYHLHSLASLAIELRDLLIMSNAGHVTRWRAADRKNVGRSRKRFPGQSAARSTVHWS